MITCTVHERDNADKDVETRADKIVFVKEGFAWFAFLFPLLWLLYHRMWLVLAGFALAFVALGLLASLTDWPQWAEALASFGINLLAGFEGNNLRRWTLACRGYVQVDVTTGRDRQECERRFFDRWLETQEGSNNRPSDSAPPAFARRPPAAPVRRRRDTGDEVIGLFPEGNR